MKISLKNRKALVGGASSGIGKAIALQLASSGADVVLMARNEEKLQRLMKELNSTQGQEHSYLLVDFEDHNSFADVISDFFSKQQVDILINNTQGPASGGALEKDIEDFQQAFDLLFKNVVLTTQLALDHMTEQKWGRIINVASVSVKEPLPYLALSNTIRAAVVTWAKSLSIDVGAYGITVNSILTGFFDTERLTQLNAKKAEKLGVDEGDIMRTMEDLTAVKRIGRPEEYGYLTAFLASDMASYLTGTAIPLDGGSLKSL